MANTRGNRIITMYIKFLCINSTANKPMKIGTRIKILIKPHSILFVEASVNLAVVLCTCRVLPESLRKVCPGLE